MMYLWKPDMIRFMRDASEYGTYNSALTEVMRPYLSESSHICDAGCGLGYLSLELAGLCRRVTAVDVNGNALAVLRENCERRGVRNITPVCADVFAYVPEEKYSAMVFCYFGGIDTILERKSDLCTGPLFIFKRNYENHRFSVGKYKAGDDGFLSTCDALRRRGVPFRAVELEAEFGQPFRSLADARCFYELYSCDENREVLTDGLLRARLVPTGREDFPLYLPHKKKTGCIIVEA